VRLSSKSKSHQGPSCCFSAVVKQSADLSIVSCDNLQELLTALGFKLDSLIFLWVHLAAQDQTEGLFGVIKRSGFVPSLLRYLLTREKYVSEIFKRLDPDRGFNLYFGDDSFYPTRELTSRAKATSSGASSSGGVSSDSVGDGGGDGCSGGCGDVTPPPSRRLKEKERQKQKRSPDENTKRMEKAREFTQKYGKPVRQGSVRTKSAENAGCLPYEVGWVAQREKNVPPAAAPSSGGGADAEADVPLAPAATSFTQPSKSVLFFKGDVILLWLGEEKDPPMLPAAVECDITSTTTTSRVRKIVSKKLSPNNIGFSWLSQASNEDEISLTLQGGNEVYSASEVLKLLKDGSLILLEGARKKSPSEWAIDDEDMERGRRNMLGQDDDNEDDGDDERGESECSDGDDSCVGMVDDDNEPVDD
jgi:hypothetical protein